ncbi:MAG TPA: glycerol-3-phosphate acyltransferase [Firmicutes bacterium]|nr:glycerol-3-phosphate acyltransferase [Bacillota bacterium]
MAMAITVSFLIGSIPTGYLAGYIWARRDPRRVGSGNVGGMNVLRNIGIVPGICTILLDIGKGVLAAVLSRGLCGGPTAWVALPACVAGHNWMPWLGFRGGKGLAVSGGALMVLHFGAAAVVFPLLGALTLALRNVDLASLLSFSLLPFLLKAWRMDWGVVLAAALVPIEYLLRTIPGKKE